MIVQFEEVGHGAKAAMGQFVSTGNSSKYSTQERSSKKYSHHQTQKVELPATGSFTMATEQNQEKSHSRKLKQEYLSSATFFS